MNASLLNRRQFLNRTAEASLALSAAIALDAASIGSAHASTGKTAAGLSQNATPRQVAESYWRAECDRDIERVGQHYHSDAIFMPPGSRLVGWNEIRKWYEDSFLAYPNVEVQITHEIRNGNEAALEWKAVLIDVAKVRHPVTGVNIIRVDGGRFREVRAYFDPSLLTGAALGQKK